jgi:KDO2-lipid IV(A) lauroyltransferase
VSARKRQPTEGADKRARDYFGSLAVGLFIRSMRHVDYPIASAWGARLGRLGYRLAGNHRRRSLANLTRAFGEAKTPDQLEGIARAFFDGIIRNVAEVVPYAGLSPEGKREYVRIVGKEKLHAALAPGRGVIALSAHLGNFLIMNSRLALEGVPVDLLVKPMRDQRVEDRMEALRGELGFDSISVKPRIKSARACLASLKRNHVLVVLGDQRPKEDGVDVNFFGMPAKAAPGPVSLALSTGAPVVPMFMLRNEDAIHHTLFIDDPIEMSVTGSKEHDLETNVQKYTDVIESYVRRTPAQWMWGHKRWVR